MGNLINCGFIRPPTPEFDFKADQRLWQSGHQANHNYKFVLRFPASTPARVRFFFALNLCNYIFPFHSCSVILCAN
jgi:hypothetical protein